MSDNDARVLDSKPIFNGRIFNISVDRVGYPDGRVVTMDVVRHRGSVVLIPMPSTDSVILVRQYRYVVNRWLWELPAGTVDPGEDLQTAAVRECHEEIGKIADRVRLIGSFFPSPGFCDEAMNFYVMTELRDRRADEHEAAQDPDELLTVRTFSLDEARSMVKRGEITDMKTALGLTLI